MVKRIVVGFLLVFALLCGMQSTLADPPKDGTTYTLKFSDEFNGSQLDETKWNYCYRWGCGPNSANAELQGYSKNAVKVSGGSLTLTGTNQSINVDGFTHMYTSGMINTKLEQNGGYWEARIKFPKGNGLWGAWWTLPINPVGKWPPEVDIVEFIGNDQDGDQLTDYETVFANLHYATNGGVANYGQPNGYNAKVDLTKDYHVYGVKWDPGKRLDYYLDGKLFRTITSNVPNEPMYGLLNLALGGSWPGNPDKTTKWPAVMYIDWVRIYQLGGSGTNPPNPPDGGTGAECPACPVCPVVPNTIKLNCTGTLNTTTGGPMVCTPQK